MVTVMAMVTGMAATAPNPRYLIKVYLFLINVIEVAKL